MENNLHNKLFRKIFLLSGGTIGTILLFAVLQYFFWLAKSFPNDRIIEINRGDSIDTIYEKIFPLRSFFGKANFALYLYLSKNQSNLIAGRYKIQRGTNYKEAVYKITRGLVEMDEVKLTFPEGSTKDEVISIITADISVSKQELQDLIEKDYREKVPGFSEYQYVSKIPLDKSIEGFLFPDTYFFKKDSDASAILKKFLDNFERKVSEGRFVPPDIHEQDFFDGIILASIVEKESSSTNDMEKIAGVFQNRLDVGMKLDSDATINYITGKKDRRSSYFDLQVDSPYNTYKYAGLPPTPIANPGLLAMKASFHPEDHDYYYFLNPDEKTTILSKTLEEHNQNKAKYFR